MKLLARVNPVNGQLILNNIEGHYKGLFLVYAGTSSATNIAAVTDVTEVRCDWNRRKGFVSLDFDNLARLMALKGGTVSDIANTAAAFRFDGYIPFAVWGDDNSYYLTSKDEFTLSVKFDTAQVIAGQFTGSPVFEVYGDEGEGETKYILNLQQITEAGIASAGVTPKSYNYENMVCAFLTPTTNLSNFAIAFGDKYYDMSLDGWRGATRLRNAVEFAAAQTAPAFTLNDPDMVEFWLAGHGTFSEMLIDNLRLNFTATGAATPDIIFATLDFADDKLDESRAVLKSLYQKRLVSKVEQNKKRPVNVLNKLAQPIG